MANAIRELYKFDVMHRDLKPQNVLITQKAGNKILKLCDFGMARYLQKKQQFGYNDPLEYDEIESYVGTPLYKAPEIEKKIPYDFRADLWCLGLILLEMLTEPLRKQKGYGSKKMLFHAFSSGKIELNKEFGL